jgi:hypothetical protein
LRSPTFGFASNDQPIGHGRNGDRQHDKTKDGVSARQVGALDQPHQKSRDRERDHNRGECIDQASLQQDVSVSGSENPHIIRQRPGAAFERQLVGSAVEGRNDEQDKRRHDQIGHDCRGQSKQHKSGRARSGWSARHYGLSTAQVAASIPDTLNPCACSAHPRCR